MAQWTCSIRQTLFAYLNVDQLADVGGGGVCRFDGAQLTTYTRADGLPNTRITSLSAKDGAVWIGTQFGLVRRAPRVIPVGGGKGGVGKTFVVANLAVALTRLGHRVIAVDADLEGPNLHTCLGLLRPPVSLADYVAHREEDLRKLVLDSSVPGLQVIAGTRGNLATPQPGHARPSGP